MSRYTRKLFFVFTLWIQLSPTCLGFTIGHSLKQPSARFLSTAIGMTNSDEIPMSSFSDEIVSIASNPKKEKQSPTWNENIDKLEAKLKKQLRQTCQKYKMIEDGDHIMVCVSGGKDSATLLYLLLALQSQLKSAGVDFKITAVHLNQMQPGYDGQPLVDWLDDLVENETLKHYKIITEDTYSIVIDKTPENKVYCSMCSRLRRGILYTVAHDIKANKIALGHHGDDAIQTLVLNLLHAGQMKSMPARYYSQERDIHVLRPLINSLEDDIASFAKIKQFPILPCNLCGTQPDAQRAKVKMLLDTLTLLNPNAKRNMMNAMGDVRPSHLLDVDLREACGMDGATGEVLDLAKALLVKGVTDNQIGKEPKSNGVTSEKNERTDSREENTEFLSQSRIESLL